MKGILFYYDNYCGSNSRGGTEVATSRIAQALQKHGGIKVYNAFLHKGPSGGETFYDGIIQLKKTGNGFEKALGAYIRSNGIEAVVNMGRFFRQRRLKRAIEESGKVVKLLFMHHFAPGSERIKPTYASGFHLLRLNPMNPLYWLRATLYPILKMPKMRTLGSTYRKVYDISDAVVLLSDGYKSDYAEIAGLETTDKLTAIPNIFNPVEMATEQSERQRRVLVISRMDEIQKRISLALRIWKKIEADPRLSDWQLDIVGAGHDMKGLKLLAGTTGLRRVFFHGWKDSRYFLERGSILMMTSLYEGMPLTLLEAQAYGVVPIVYDSYATVKEVMTDGEDGLSVSPFGDVDGFAARLSSLMLDEDLRSRLAAKGRESSRRFSEEKIATKWLSLLDSL